MDKKIFKKSQQKNAFLTNDKNLDNSLTGRFCDEFYFVGFFNLFFMVNSNPVGYGSCKVT